MFGSMTSTFIILAVVFSLPPIKRLPLAWRWVLCIALIYSLNMPLQNLSVTGYITGVIGELSLTSATILFLLIASRLTDPHTGSTTDATTDSITTDSPLIDKRCIPHLAASLGLVALFLYPMALGATEYDPYAFGLQPQFLILATLAYSLSVIILGYFPIALLLSAVLVGYSFSIMESQNFWDYLIDPFLALYGVSCFLMQVYAALRWVFSTRANRAIEKSAPLIWRPQSNKSIPQNVESTATLTSASKRIINTEKVQ